MSDLISRQAAIDAFEDTTYTKNEIRRRITELPSAQQDCTECEEYDTERHYCPRYCDVIRQTVEEAKQERTGRWMATEADEPCFYRCSECGRLIDERENFCPNCGARTEDTNESD